MFVRKNNYFIFTILIFFSGYFFLGTGIHSDDYSAIYQSSERSFTEFFTISPDKLGQNFFGVLNYYFFYWIYEFFSYENEIIYDCFKFFINLITFFLIYYFSKNFFDNFRAIIFSLLFVFYPSHDSTLYWYMTAPYIFTAGIIFLSFHLILKNYFKLGFILLCMGSFLSYSSPPYVFGLSIIFLLKKNYKKFLFFVIPGIIYVLFYLYFGLINNNEYKFDKKIEISSFFKNLLLQIFSSIDSLIGPNFFLKIYYSVLSLSITSLIIYILISFAILFTIKRFNFIYNNNSHKLLFVGLIFIFIFSLLMFSLTGRYNHSSFNLGNRVTIYGSLLFAFLITYFISNKKKFIIVLFVLMLINLGLSDHWKEWNLNQKTIIQKIQNNDDLKNLNQNDTLIITNNLYSKLGIFSHIEFFSQPWIIAPIFNQDTNNPNKIVLSEHTKILNDKIIDTKYNRSIKLSNNIYLYNTHNDSLVKISIAELIIFKKNIKNEIRHWIQLINNNKIKKLIIFLSPRLNIYFSEKQI